jgi:hypothetical protein
MARKRYKPEEIVAFQSREAGVVRRVPLLVIPGASYAASSATRLS